MINFQVQLDVVICPIISADLSDNKPILGLGRLLEISLVFSNCRAIAKVYSNCSHCAPIASRHRIFRRLQNKGFRTNVPHSLSSNWCFGIIILSDASSNLSSRFAFCLMIYLPRINLSFFQGHGQTIFDQPFLAFLNRARAVHFASLIL